MSPERKLSLVPPIQDQQPDLEQQLQYTFGKMGERVDMLNATEASGGKLEQADINEMHEWGSRVKVTETRTPGKDLGGGVEIPDTIERKYSFNSGTDENPDYRELNSNVGEKLLSFTAAHIDKNKAGKAQDNAADDNNHKASSGVGRGNGVTHKRDKIGDLLDDGDHKGLDATGRARYNKAVKTSYDSEGNKVAEDQKLGKTFITKKELDLIEQHEQQIRGGLEERDAENKLRDAQKAFDDIKNKDGNTEPPVGDEPDDPGGPSGPDGPDGPDDPYKLRPGESPMRAFSEDDAEELAYALNEYTKLAAGRERSTLAPGFTKEKVEAARQRYEELRLKAKEWERDKMEALGLESADVIMVSKLQDKTEAKMAALGIKFDAEKLAEPTGMLAGTRKKFYDWWARQSTGKFFSKGTLKKAAAMGLIGLPVGVAAGAAGVFLAGPLVGGALAAGAARGVSRGLMRGRIDKNAQAKTVAAANYEKRLAAQLKKIDEDYVPYEDGSIYNSESVTDVYAKGVEKNVNRNRRRMLGSVAIGAVAGGIGGEIFQNFWGGHGGGHQPAKTVTPKGPKLYDNPPASGGAPEVQPVSLSLGHSGDSIWAETVQYAQEHGVNLGEDQKEHIVGEILKSNNQTWASARDLPIGYQFQINPEELNELLKAS